MSHEVPHALILGPTCSHLQLDLILCLYLLSMPSPTWALSILSTHFLLLSTIGYLHTCFHVWYLSPSPLSAPFRDGGESLVTFLRKPPKGLLIPFIPSMVRTCQLAAKSFPRYYPELKDLLHQRLQLFDVGVQSLLPQLGTFLISLPSSKALYEPG